MKNSKNYLCLAGFALAVAVVGCSESKKEKITDIPITTQSAEAKASCEQGLALMDIGEGQKAKTFFIKATEQDPKLAIAYILKSGTNETAKEFADDMAKAKINLEGVSDYEKQYYDYIATFLNRDWDKRLEITQKIADTYPDAARAQMDLGFTYVNGNQYDKARACFEKAKEINPKWVGGYSALVNSYLFFDPKDYKKAEENALKVVELAPTSPAAEITLGDCYRAQNNLEKAKDSYSKAIELDPNVAEPYNKKGNANTFLGNYDEARQNYMEGEKHEEIQTGYNPAIAYTYLYGGDQKTAMNVLAEQAVKIDSSAASADKKANEKLNCLTTCANIAMHYGDATKLKELMVMIAPLTMQTSNDIGTEEARLNGKGTILYWESMAAAMEGNYDAAKSKAEEMKTTLAPVKDPNKLDPYDFALGYIAMKQKNYSEAVSHFEKTLQASIYNKYWLAMANEAAGNKDKANSLFKEISVYNFNGTDNALIRKEVKDKLAAG